MAGLDPDGDGNLEPHVLFTILGDVLVSDTFGYLVAVDGRTWQEAWSHLFAFYWGADCAPAVGDIDNDGRMEAVFLASDAMWKDTTAPGYLLVFSLEKGGSYLEYVDTLDDNPLGSSPLLADLDGDLKLDIVFLTNEGVVYFYESDGRDSYRKQWEYVTDGFPR